jgi:hypothetical protein
MANKSKDLSITSYLDVLQKEYLVAEIRHKIYPKISDKSYWERVMEGKRQKVEDICFRNRISSIFDNDSEKKRLYLEIYNETGLPNFVYKDEEQRIGSSDFPGLEETDIVNYYSVDSEVRVDYGGKRLFGKITEFDFKQNIVFVKIDGVEYECDSKTVTRIL